MSNILLRTVVGRPLTNAEIDLNFTNLNNDKLEATIGQLSLLSSATSLAQAQSNLGILNYSALTATAGQLNGGNTTPTNTVRLNYEGNFYATNFYGNGSNLTSLNANNLSSGTIATARLGSGTANNTTFLRGDNTWATVTQYTPPLTLTANATGFSITGGTTSKTLTVNNTANLSGTDGSTLNIGAGGFLFLTAGSANSGSVNYSGTTVASGQFNGGTTNPTNTVRLNYEGNFYATNFYGNGSNLTSLNGSNISSGTIAAARLGSGTTDTTTFLRGDNTWATVTDGASVTDDNATNTNAQYVTFSRITTGTLSTAYTASTKCYFNPSTGTLSATNLNSLSDKNAKENVVNIQNALSVVNQLQGVEYNWKDNGLKGSGLIADEVEKVLPHLVETSEEGVKTLNYIGIIGYLIEAIKELGR